ncbi:MAG: hypothetical protein M3124_02870, partial [Actinomycetota bacterium]|nr:hypothetical protein [Actinomycetota bacterium]
AMLVVWASWGGFRRTARSPRGQFAIGLLDANSVIGGLVTVVIRVHVGHGFVRLLLLGLEILVAFVLVEFRVF